MSHISSVSVFFLLETNCWFDFNHERKKKRANEIIIKLWQIFKIINQKISTLFSLAFVQGFSHFVYDLDFFVVWSDLSLIVTVVVLKMLFKFWLCEESCSWDNLEKQEENSNGFYVFVYVCVRVKFVWMPKCVYLANETRSNLRNLFLFLCVLPALKEQMCL